MFGRGVDDASDCLESRGIGVQVFRGVRKFAQPTLLASGDVRS
jgi:hypothetical protein